MTFAMGGAPAPGSDRILVELFQILKDDAVESAALNMQYELNMQYTGSRQKSVRSASYSTTQPRPFSPLQWSNLGTFQQNLGIPQFFPS